MVVYMKHIYNFIVINSCEFSAVSMKKLRHLRDSACYFIFTASLSGL